MTVCNCLPLFPLKYNLVSHNFKFTFFYHRNRYESKYFSSGKSKTRSFEITFFYLGKNNEAKLTYSHQLIKYFIKLISDYEIPIFMLGFWLALVTNCRKIPCLQFLRSWDFRAIF